MIAGQQVELSIEKPAAGGRMIARLDGRVVFVRGAIPGERVLARVEKADRQLAFATAVEVLDPSPDRRDVRVDPLCGGCVYAHIAYARQVALKAEMIADAFGRIGRIPLQAPVRVAASPDQGYRMRARFFVRGDAAGFYREGTHDICDAAITGQVRDDTVAAVNAAVSSLSRDGAAAASIEVAENLDASHRAAHVEGAFGAQLSEPVLARAAAAAQLRGCTARTAAGVLMSTGAPWVSDSLHALTLGRAETGELRRHPEAFFQANRFLLPSLVAHVLDAVGEREAVLDLYAGVGLFSLSLAAAGRSGITAVEGNAASGADLKQNAAPFADAVRVVIGSVEEHLAARRTTADTVIVDPPRTGISKEAMQAIVRHGARRVVYVSCDAATMARDARRLVDAAYEMVSLEAFDLFPNTPHVETVAVFGRQA